MIHAIQDLGLHWVLWDIAADTRGIAMNVARLAEPPAPAGSKQVKTNIDGAAWFGYVGPCPHGPSSNQFAVYALDVEILQGVTTQSTATQVDTLIKSHSLARATLTGASR